MPYKPELDLLRFFALLGIFMFHGMLYCVPEAAAHHEIFHWLSLGQWGVPIFFFLSAFLITEILRIEKATYETISIRHFYIRRCLRIWPLYFGFYIATAIANNFLPGVNPKVPASWPYFTVFLVNYYILHFGWTHGAADALWSISIEEQFYVFVPVLIAWASRRVLIGVALAIISLSYLTIYYNHAILGAQTLNEWLNSFIEFQFFAAGTLLALLLKGHTPQWRWPLRAVFLALAIACLTLAETRYGLRGNEPNISAPEAMTGWLLILAACMLAMLSFLGLSVERVPSLFIYLGRISYGLYVFHGLFYILAFHFLAHGFWSPEAVGKWWRPYAMWSFTGIVFGLTVLAAHLSYQYYEKPFLQLKRHFRSATQDTPRYVEANSEIQLR